MVTFRKPTDSPAGPNTYGAIGRERPFSRLLDHLQQALNGSGRTCLITGEAGIGKTRLLEDLLARAQARDCHVLRGRAQDYDHGIAYSSLRDLLGSAGTDDFDDQSSVVYADLLRALDSSVLGQPTGVQSAYLLTTKLLSSLCLDRPTIIALDDAYLSDDETLTALSLAARHLNDLPLFLVASTRLDTWLPGSHFAATIGRLIDSGLGEAVELGPLNTDDTAALLAAELPGRPDDRLASYVYARSRGNPLFAREALRALEELNALRSEHGVCYLVGDPAAGLLSRRAALLHRIFQQDRASRELARVMSAFRRIHLDHIGTLEAVTDMDRERIERAFDDLSRASIITRVSSGWYEFAHPLIAEVLYNDLGPLERRRLHKLIAESFSHRAVGIDVLEWTTHIAEAATPGDQDAIDAVLKAARLTRDTAPLSAATWYARALDLLPPERPEHGEILARQALSLWKGSRPEAAIDVGTQALAERPPDRLRTRILATVVNATYAMGRYGDGLAITGEQIDGIPEPAPFLAQRAVMLAHLGRSDEAEREVDRAAVLASAGAGGDKVVTYSFIGHAYSCLGDFRHADAAMDRLAEIGLSQASGVSRGARLSALESSAYVYALMGHLPEARRLMEKVTDLLPETGWQDVGGQYVFTKARLEFITGDWDAALATIRAGAVDLESAGLWNNLAWMRLLEAEILTEQAQLDEAAHVLDAELLPAECALYTVQRQCRLARIATARGEHDRAGEMLAAQRRTVRDSGMDGEAHRRCLEALVDLGLVSGDERLAGRYAAELDDLARRTAIPITITSAEIAKIALGDVCLGERLATEFEADGRKFHAGQAHLYLAPFAAERERHLDRALELFRSMDAQLWVDRATTLAQRLGISFDPGPRPLGGSASKCRLLTPNEIQLVRLLRQGLTNRQISAVMHYSPKTIEVYVSRLYRKVGYRSRIELILAAERGELRELLPGEEDLTASAGSG